MHRVFRKVADIVGKRQRNPIYAELFNWQIADGHNLGVPFLNEFLHLRT